MPEPRHLPDRLVEASALLHYEVVMFDATAQMLMTGVFGESAARNAFLESFTIHTRVLLQFFYPSSSIASDVLAEHFFSDRMIWLRLRGRVPKALLDVERRVGNEIAHLSYDRLTVGPDAKKWNVLEIWKAVMGLVRTFVANVPPNLLSSDLQRSSPQEQTASVSSATGASTGTVMDVSSTALNQSFQATSQSHAADRTMSPDHDE